MNIFTYYDYIKCIHNINLKNAERLAEESEEYRPIPTKDKELQLNQKPKDKPHDKLIKNILKDKNELANLVNQFLKPRQILKSENLQKYTNSYITKKYKSKEADMVYKMKDKKMYFLIEHQSTIDYNMPYRILNYCIDIIQEWTKEKRNKQIAKYPIIVPIVIYTGEQRWKVPLNYKEQQIKVTTYEKYRIDLAYNLIDINNYNIYELLSKKTMFSYALLIEKSKDREELLKNIKLIVKNEKDKNILEKLAYIIVYLLDEILEEDEQNQLLEIIQNKIGGENMEALVARIMKEEKRKMKRIEQKGIEKVKLQISKKMLDLGQEDNFIKEVTGISDKELEKIKNRNNELKNK